LKTIDTLVEDIGSVLVNKVESLPPELTQKFADSLSQLITNRLTKQSEDRPVGLRMSNIGSPCGRKLWYEVNQKEDAEPLRADTLLKFMFGDVVEELVLFLAEVAGHTVEGRQDTQVIAGIEGHRDAVIDGVTVDVKSANTYGFNKFKNHGLEGDDPFGYQDQLQSSLLWTSNLVICALMCTPTRTCLGNTSTSSRRALYLLLSHPSVTTYLNLMVRVEIPSLVLSAPTVSTRSLATPTCVHSSTALAHVS